MASVKAVKQWNNNNHLYIYFLTTGEETQKDTKQPLPCDDGTPQKNCHKEYGGRINLQQRRSILGSTSLFSASQLASSAVQMALWKGERNICCKNLALMS